MNQEQIEQVKNTLYVLKWTFEGADGIGQPTGEDNRVEKYSWHERQVVIDRYLNLKEKWYASNIKIYVAHPQEVTIESLLDTFYLS
jgi:hypothetical protein